MTFADLRIQHKQVVAGIAYAFVMCVCFGPYISCLPAVEETNQHEGVYNRDSNYATGSYQNRTRLRRLQSYDNLNMNAGSNLTAVRIYYVFWCHVQVNIMNSLRYRHGDGLTLTTFTTTVVLPFVPND